jgi:hypothetical protein
MTDEMVEAIVCREMHWTSEQYQAQPIEFINRILRMMNAQGEAEQKANKK